MIAQSPHFRIELLLIALFFGCYSVANTSKTKESQTSQVELKWLETYSGQTTEELLALEGEYRIDSLALAFEQALQAKAHFAGSSSLTVEENVVLAVEALEREVNNGGYWQLFINSSKEYAPIFVSALNRIGRSEVADLTQLAIDILEIEGPLNVEAIDRAMQEESVHRDERLTECDRRYFEIAGDLSGPLFAFIKNNRKRVTLRQSDDHPD